MLSSGLGNKHPGSETRIAKAITPIKGTYNMAASLSGLTEEQAQGIHAQFKIGFQTWLAIAIVAHVLVFAWRPWF